MARKSSNPHAAALVAELKDGPKVGDDLNGNAAALTKARKNAGSPRAQVSLTGKGLTEARAEFDRRGGDHAVKAQEWRDAVQLRRVRMDDLEKVYRHRPLDVGTAADVSGELAKAIRDEKISLDAKQEAKRAVNQAWQSLRSLMGEKSAKPLIEDSEEDTE